MPGVDACLVAGGEQEGEQAVQHSQLAADAHGRRQRVLLRQQRLAALHVQPRLRAAHAGNPLPCSTCASHEALRTQGRQACQQHNIRTTPDWVTAALSTVHALRSYTLQAHRHGTLRHLYPNDNLAEGKEVMCGGTAHQVGVVADVAQLHHAIVHAAHAPARLLCAAAPAAAAGR